MFAGMFLTWHKRCTGVISWQALLYVSDSLLFLTSMTSMCVHLHQFVCKRDSNHMYWYVCMFVQNIWLLLQDQIILPSVYNVDFVHVGVMYSTAGLCVVSLADCVM